MREDPKRKLTMYFVVGGGDCTTQEITTLRELRDFKRNSGNNAICFTCKKTDNKLYFRGADQGYLPIMDAAKVWLKGGEILLTLLEN